MLNRDQVMNTQQQLFTQGIASRTTMPNGTAPNVCAQGMVAKNSFGPAPTPRSTQLNMMTKQSMPMKMGMHGSSLKPSFGQAPSLNAAASRSRQFQMLVGPPSATSAKPDHSRFMAPKMVASTPKVNGSFGFGSSLQHSASVVQNSRSKIVMKGSTVTDAPTVRNLDITSFTESRPAKTEKVDNVTEKGDVPNNTFKPKDPYMGTVVSNTTLTGPDAGEVCHIVFEHEGKLPYAEGQSVGIVAEG